MDELIPNLMVEDVGATVGWYERTFDADVVDEVRAGEPAERVWAQLELGDVSLMVQRRDSLEARQPSLSGEEIGGSFGLYILADDVAGLYARLVERDADVVAEPAETWYGRREFAVRDVNGYLLWFAERGEGG